MLTSLLRWAARGRFRGRLKQPAWGGTVGMIGVLSQGDFNPARVMRKSIHLQGIYVGSRRMFEDMNRAIEHHAIKPVLDQQFAFDAAPAAFHAMQSQQHFGKIVLQV